MISRPEDGSFGPGVETFRIEQCSLVVIPEQADAALHDQVDTLARVRSVAHHIAQTENVGDLLLLDIRQHGLERFQISVNIADNRFQVDRS